MRLGIAPFCRPLRGLSRSLPALLLVGLSGCSYAYHQGLELEEQERWEEAAVEFQSASISRPQDEEIRGALERVKPKVAAGYLKDYQNFLQKRQYLMAFRRLEATAALEPENEVVQAEWPKWRKVLVAGQVDLEIENLRRNLRLADEMQLQAHLNSPSGDLLVANLSPEGVFFVEDVLYQLPNEALATYTLHAIGLSLRQKTSQGFTRKEFESFILFRDPVPLTMEGRLEVQDRTPQSLFGEEVPETTDPAGPWTPPRLLQYRLQFEGDVVRVQDAPRTEFLAERVYLNTPQHRGYVSFGRYQVRQQEGRWTIERLPSTGLMSELARNYALAPYFSYTDAFPVTL